MMATRPHNAVAWKDGERVVLKHHRESHPMLGKTGSIRNYKRISSSGPSRHDMVEVEFDGYPYKPGQFNYFANRFVGAIPLVVLDPTKVRTTRYGHPVANVEQVSGDRPLRAEVFVDQKWLVLSFEASGHFYGHHDQPIDLVEAK